MTLTGGSRVPGTALWLVARRTRALVARLVRSRPAMSLVPGLAAVSLAAGGSVVPGLSVPHLAVARASIQHGDKLVSYRGYKFEVPVSWPVINLTAHPNTCVRFDRHALYLGRPGANELCPTWLIGKTESVLIQPGPARAKISAVESPVARQVTVTAPRIRITATFDKDPRLIYQILAVAFLAKPVRVVPASKRSEGWAAGTAAASDARPLTATAAKRSGHRSTVRAAQLPAYVVNYHGLGFDSCTAPSGSYMRAWRRHSPYRAVGIYIGGSDRACAQQNLTANWVREQARLGWRFIPLYVGPQAEFGELTAPRRQARQAAADAVVQARRLGFGPDTPIYYDMEAYLPGVRAAALQFLSAWSIALHHLGYRSGVYSSSLSGIRDIAGKYHNHRYEMPDVIFDGLWNGKANTSDAVLPRSEWPKGRRLHQFRGNVIQKFGGDRIDIDQDYVNVSLANPGGTSEPASAVALSGGSIELFYNGPSHHLWRQDYLPATGWSQPVSMGGRVVGHPSAVLAGSQVAVFYRDQAGHLLEAWKPSNGRWHGPTVLALAGLVGGRPRAVAQPNGVIDVFWQGRAHHQLQFAEYDPGAGWSGPQSLGGKLASVPWPVESPSGTVEVFWKGEDGRLWRVVRPVAGQWDSPAVIHAGRLGSAPRAIAMRGAIEVFWRGAGAQHAMWATLIQANRRPKKPRRLSATPTDNPWPIQAGGAVRVLFRDQSAQLAEVVGRSWSQLGGPPVTLPTGVLNLAPNAVMSADHQYALVFWLSGQPHGLWWAVLSAKGLSPPQQLAGPAF